MVTATNLAFLRATAIAVAIASAGARVQAQSGNGSDVTGPPSFNLAGGAFAPLPMSGGARTASGAAVLARTQHTATEFSAGSPQRSLVTGALIPTEAVQAVGELMATGSPAAEARVARALQADGALPEDVAFLTQALGEFSRVGPNEVPYALISVSKRFNTLVKNAPSAFMRNPPPIFLAIHAALVPMVNALRR